jgi:hypothetical protein
MHALRCQHLTRKLKAGKDIIPLKIGELGEDLLYGIAPRQVFEDTLDGIAQTTDAGLAMTHLRINRDT